MIPKHRPHFDRSEFGALLHAKGDAVQEFEKVFASGVGSKYAIAFPYGRAGLFALLCSQGLKGTEIILPAYTCIVVPNAILASGNIPRFVDITLDDFNMDLKGVESAASQNAGAVIATHMFGYPMDVARLRERFGSNTLIIEDACLAFGTRDVGKWSDACFYSMNLGKQLTSLDGGVVTTNDARIEAKLRTFRDAHFQRASFRKALRTIVLLGAYRFLTGDLAYGFIYAAWSRCRFLKKRTRNWDLEGTDLPADLLQELTGVQAAIGIAQLRKAAQMRAAREKNILLYHENLGCAKGLILPPIVEGAACSHYSLRTRDRDALLKVFEKHGVQAGTTFDYCLPLTSVYRKYSDGEFPNAQEAASQVLNLPIYPSLRASAMDSICEIVRSFLSAQGQQSSASRHSARGNFSLP